MLSAMGECGCAEGQSAMSGRIEKVRAYQIVRRDVIAIKPPLASSRRILQSLLQS